MENESQWLPLEVRTEERDDPLDVADAADAAELADASWLSNRVKMSTKRANSITSRTPSRSKSKILKQTGTTFGLSSVYRQGVR